MLVDTGTLNPALLIAAYANGYFPMPHSETEEILWYRPDPRAILPLDSFHCPRSLQKAMRRLRWQVRIDTAFREVMQGCAERPETWINEEMCRAYDQMFALGHAHSIEVWLEGKLVGGLYGIALGGAFFAESKFHRVRDASKIALFHLVQHLKEKRFTLLEVQFLTAHLERFGVKEVSDGEYQALLEHALKLKVKF